MSSAPKMSVIITTYNRSQRMKRAVYSVLGQTYSSFELHIVDDCSTDNTQDIVQVLLSANANLHYWKHKKNKGLSAARNTGIAKSRGEYIAFLDDDDEWKPDSLGKRIALLEKLSEKEQEKLGVVYCGCEIHIPHENRITYNMPKIEGNIKKYIINNDLSTIPSSCLFPKKILQDIGGFDESLSSSVDHDIWMNLASHGYYAFPVKEALVITYSIKRRPSMVSDTYQRIRGVEQFLTKWGPVYQEWYGREGGKHYIRAYRTRVLGGLAGKKMCEGNYREAWQLMKHINGSNGMTISNNLVLVGLIARCLIREFIPVKLIGLIKRPIHYTERIIGQ